MPLHLFNLPSRAEWEPPGHWPGESGTHRDTEAFWKGIWGFCRRYRTVSMLGEAASFANTAKEWQSRTGVVCVSKLQTASSTGSRNSRRQALSLKKRQLEPLSVSLGKSLSPVRKLSPFFRSALCLFVSTGEAREAAQLSCFQHKHSFLVCIKHHEWVIFSTPFQNILFSISAFFSMLLWERSKTSSLVSLAAFCCCFKPQPKFKPWPRRGN